MRVVQVLIDLAIFSGSLATAYAIRFEGSLPPRSYKQLILLLPYLAIARFGINALLGIYRVVWRYIGLREMLRFAQAVAVVSLVLLLFRLAYPTNNPYLRVPISIIVLEGFFTFVGLTGIRVLRRVLHERGKRASRRVSTEQPALRTLLIGAGEAGLAIAKESQKSADLALGVVGYLDDDAKKQRMEIHGVRVLGTLADLQDVVEAKRVKQVFITTNAIPSRKILEITDWCRPRTIDVRIVPALYEILGANLLVSSMREVRIEDLLSRDPIPPSMTVQDLTETYGGKRVLVTGAGGSIGSEMCRQLALMNPASILLLERDETNLFEIDRELRANGTTAICKPLLADIDDSRAMDRIFRENEPEAVFHAAALKHVPLMEEFSASSARTNVLGTRSLVDLVRRHGVESFVMISTDKAVNPSSVMGATKRLAELIVQNAAPTMETRFSCVRFGNVLGSRGSVSGIFQNQIRNGGPITVTHPNATRYFMTIQEAVNLVLQAATLGRNGEVFILDMGEPVRIIDLARQMLRLSGLSEDDIPIEIVGTRPGEKLFEELQIDGEDISTTDLRKIHRHAPLDYDPERLEATLERLQFLVSGDDHEGVRAALRGLNIGYARDRSRSAEPDFHR